jgi:hypothetical protein
MISHLLDTDMLTLFQHGHTKVSARCAAAAPGSLAVTIISIEEQFLGWYTRARQAKRDDDIASAYGRMTLSKIGQSSHRQGLRSLSKRFS